MRNWKSVALVAGVLVAHPTVPQAQPAAELAAAHAILSQRQPLSFAENKQYCGYIGVLGDSRYMAADVTRGRSDSCLPRSDESRFVGVKASLHTHARFGPGADSEVPSSNDLEGDMSERVNGYVATPGGRLWFIDGRTGLATQVCPTGCMGQSPDFVAGHAGPIAGRYAWQELRQRERKW